jgi:outer membrane protein assembly factor BamB
MAGTILVRAKTARARTLGAMAAGWVMLAPALGFAEGSPGPLAGTCGAPSLAVAAGMPPGGQPHAKSGVAIFPAGQYPVKLPDVSLLGARNDLPNPYKPAESWGKLPPGRVWGSVASVSIAPDGTIWAADRCGENGSGGAACIGKNVGIDPIFHYDKNGKLLGSMGKGLFVNVHKLSVDGSGFLWVADNSGNQVFKLDPKTGKVLLTIGKRGVTGHGEYEFDGPTEVAVAPNGDIFVSDGHNGGGTPNGNARVVKYDKSGKFIMSFGHKGMGPGEFDQVHTLAFDSQGRLFVGDRQNNRSQIFTQDGKWLAVWYQFGRPSGIYIDKNDVMYVTDSESRDGRTNSGEFAMRETGYGYNLGARRGIRIGSARDGAVTAFIADPCPYPYDGVSTQAEGVTADFDGNVYAGDFLGDIHKFVKK